jgi:hypothetical protein
MDVKLIIVGAKTGTKEISVKKPRIIGRTRGIGIVIPHPSVNERHCLLFENEGLLMIQDLNSEHGTLVGGRKIITAPLPPGTEFTVGPLTLRAEYHYAGNRDSLPKILYDESGDDNAAPANAEVTHPVPDLQTEPSVPAPPESSSFFGLAGEGNLPAIVQPPASDRAKPQENIAVGHKKPEPIRMPPPLPKISEPTTPTRENETNSAAVSSEAFEESESGIPGLNVDAALSANSTTTPTEHGKKKPAGFLDYFGKRPSRPNRAARLIPDHLDTFDETESPQETPAKSKQDSSEKKTNSIVPNEEIPAEPPVEVDDDLSNFFKRLE